jgi:hypothetical protein
MLDSISKGLELGFNRLTNNMPAMNAAGYDLAIHDMMAKIINICYNVV